jgi:hypothetical protein
VLHLLVQILVEEQCLEPLLLLQRQLDKYQYDFT